MYFLLINSIKTDRHCSNSIIMQSYQMILNDYKNARNFCTHTSHTLRHYVSVV